jgi:hypothetical protein
MNIRAGPSRSTRWRRWDKQEHRITDLFRQQMTADEPAEFAVLPRALTSGNSTRHLSLPVLYKSW